MPTTPAPFRPAPGSLVPTSTDGLRTGDVVWHPEASAVLFIDGPVYSRDRADGSVWWTYARVLNLTDDRDALAASFIRQDGGRWTVQGNERATWAVVVDPAPVLAAYGVDPV